MHRSESVLRAVAEMREQFLRFAHRLQAETNVVTVTSDLDVRLYGGMVCIESFVEAKLQTGNFVVWWIDVREKDNRWEVEAVVFVQHDEGQDDIARLPQALTSSDEELAAAISGISERLLADPDEHLRTALEWTPSAEASNR